MKRTWVACAAMLALTGCVAAQMPQTHHRCWDIDLVASGRERVAIEPPYIIATADSGLMLVAIAKEYLGTPYRVAGRTPRGFDCSGFAMFLYRKFGYELPGYSGGQARIGEAVTDRRNLKAGDLVFFGGRHHTHTVGHTGIVVDVDTASGEFRFIHSSTTAGVIISRSSEPYYSTRYMCAKRLLNR